MLYQRAAMALVAVFSLLPSVSYAGAGGSPTAPAAGQSSYYCCAELLPVPQSGADLDGRNQISFFNGNGCRAIGGELIERINCEWTVIKCRGERFTPSAETPMGLGAVRRCLTP